MACNTREKTGSCGHHQCPFSNETSHGYECIDIFTEEVEGALISFCEVGEGCLEKCRYSYNKGTNSPQEQAAEIFINRIIN